MLGDRVLWDVGSVRKRTRLKGTGRIGRIAADIRSIATLLQVLWTSKCRTGFEGTVGIGKVATDRGNSIGTEL
jgi:hypothetical protein